MGSVSLNSSLSISLKNFFEWFQNVPFWLLRIPIFGIFLFSVSVELTGIKYLRSVLCKIMVKTCESWIPPSPSLDKVTVSFHKLYYELWGCMCVCGLIICVRFLCQSVQRTFDFSSQPHTCTWHWPAQHPTSQLTHPCISGHANPNTLPTPLLCALFHSPLLLMVQCKFV